MQVTPQSSPPLLLLPRLSVTLQEEGVCSEPYPLCSPHTITTKYTLAHHTHEGRPRLHSPQASLAMKGAKWAGEKGKGREKKHRKEKEGQSRTQLGCEEVERQEVERNHRSVKCWVDCGHATTYSGTNRGPEGQKEARKAEVTIKEKTAKDILSLGLLFCLLANSDNDLSAAEVQEFFLWQRGQREGALRWGLLPGDAEGYGWQERYQYGGS